MLWQGGLYGIPKASNLSKSFLNSHEKVRLTWITRECQQNLLTKGYPKVDSSFVLREPHLKVASDRISLFIMHTCSSILFLTTTLKTIKQGIVFLNIPVHSFISLFPTILALVNLD